MPTYKVVNKFIFRASVKPTVMGVRPDGTEIIVHQKGETDRVEVGTLLTDVTEQELAAFPDRFELVSADPAVGPQAPPGAPPVPPPPEVTPPAPPTEDEAESPTRSSSSHTSRGTSHR